MSARVSREVVRAGPVDSRDWLVLLGLTGLWVALVLIVDPRGNFPTMDDWSYGRSVKTLLEQHRLEYDGWNNPTLFLQVLYGALFCLPFGFSFEALRISVLVAGLAGGIGTYALLRQGRASRCIAVFGSLLLLLNPVYFQYSFAFMTDVPFAALAVISAVFYLRALRTESSIGDVAAGTAIACAATLVRQIGIAIPIGYAVSRLLVEGFRRRTLLLSGPPAIVTGAVLVVYNGIVDYLDMTPAMSGAVQKLILLRLETYGPFGVVTEALKLGVWLFTYGAFFILPLLLLTIGRKVAWQDLSPRTRVLATVMCGAFFLLLLSRNLPPSQPLRVFSIHPVGMLGFSGWGVIPESTIFRTVLSVAAMGAAALMAAIMIAFTIRYVKRGWFGRRDDAAAALFGMATTAIMLAPTLLTGFMERYLIPAMPFVMLALIAAWQPTHQPTRAPRHTVAAVLPIMVLMAYAVVALAYVHDFLVWNRVRWKAVDYLVREHGIAPARIDGGHQVNGWYLFPTDERLRKRFINWQIEQGSTVFWRNEAAEYLICFARCDKAHSAASQVLWAQRYTGWLPGADGTLVIQRYDASGGGQGFSDDSTNG